MGVYLFFLAVKEAEAYLSASAEPNLAGVF